MRRGSAETPDAYVDQLDGWRKELVARLRAGVRRASRSLDETLKYGHLVYESNGPVLSSRAEDERVLFGFWRGQRLTELEPRLKGSGKYELATLELREGDTVKPGTVRTLVAEAVALNTALGDPRAAAKGRER